MFSEGTVPYGNSFTVVSNFIPQLFDKTYYKNLGGPMACGDTLAVDSSSETPVQRELKNLKYDILAAQSSIKVQKALLLIARTKLAAVKKLVK